MHNAIIYIEQCTNTKHFTKVEIAEAVSTEKYIIRYVHIIHYYTALSLNLLLELFLTQFCKNFSATYYTTVDLVRVTHSTP